MNNKTRLIKRKDLQQGISLIVSLIMLLIMTVIGIGAMNTSVSKVKMTSSIQQQSFVSNSTEESLIQGETSVDTGATVAGASIYTNNDGFFNQNNPVILNNVNWNNAFNGANNDSQYIIEYLGRDDAGESAGVGNDPNALNEEIHIYRVTARSVNANQTTRIFQSLYLSETRPN